MPSPEPRIPFEADVALRRGEKLQAVKITREKLGLSLKDAKDLCDAWSPHDPPPPAPDPAAPRASMPPGELPAAAVDALVRGNKIEAIKAYREATGEGLRESKEAVEAWEAAHPELAPATACDSRGCERRGCGAGRLLLALLALGLIAAAVHFSGVLG